MRISVGTKRDKVVIAVAEEAWRRPGADMFLSRMKELSTRGVGTVVVDLHDMRLAGAAFLGALAAGAAEIERVGGKVVLTGVGRSVGRILTATGLHRVLTIGTDCRPEAWKNRAEEESEQGLVRLDAQTEGPRSEMPGLTPAAV